MKNVLCKVLEIIIVSAVLISVFIGGWFVIKHQSSSAFELGILMMVGSIVLLGFYIKDSFF